MEIDEWSEAEAWEEVVEETNDDND